MYTAVDGEFFAASFSVAAHCNWDSDRQPGMQGPIYKISYDLSQDYLAFIVG